MGRLTGLSQERTCLCPLPAPNRPRKIEKVPGVQAGRVQGAEAAPPPPVSNTSPYYIISPQVCSIGKVCAKEAFLHQNIIFCTP